MLSFIKRFLTKTLIAFYKENDTFYVQKLNIKKGKIIETENKDFQKEKEFLEFIKKCLMNNTQTYISTLIMNYNQGCVDSCSTKRYRELQIHTDHVKISCINKKFSIYVGILELEDFKKSMQKYHVDLIYSPYLIIDLNKENTPKSLYILVGKEFLVLVIYTNELPEYSAIYDVNKADENRDNNLEMNMFDNDDSEITDIEEIGVDDLDNVDNLDSLDNLDNLDNNNSLEEELEEENGEELELKEESDIKNFIKDSLKDYYENYAEDFIENIYLLKSYNFKSALLKKELEDELLVKVKTKNIDLVTDLNSLARKDVNV